MELEGLKPKGIKFYTHSGNLNTSSFEQVLASLVRNYGYLVWKLCT